jgi:phosphohistidine phosphatase SixA
VHRLAKAGAPALIVGHNPQLENLVATLSESGKHLHTGELVAFDINDDPKALEAKEVARLRFDDTD